MEDINSVLTDGAADVMTPMEPTAEPVESKATEIYSVSFHTKSPLRTRTFWFTDLDMATMFAESLLSNRKVIDCTTYAVKANVGEEYLPSMNGEQVSMIEMWKREPRGNWQVTRQEETDQPSEEGAKKKHTRKKTASAAERMET